MKHADFKPCAICHKGMMHGGSPMFYRVTIDRFIVDMNAVRRAHGMELMVGNALLANVMGPNEDLAKRFSGHTVLVCNECLIDPRASLAVLLDAAPREDPPEFGDDEDGADDDDG